MTTNSRVKQIKKGLRNADDILHLLTGKRLKNVVGRGINLFGEELGKKVVGMFDNSVEKELPVDNPYRILGVHPEALDIVVRGAYRSLAREYHPDTGTKPDSVKFQQATEAFNAIKAARQQAAQEN